MAHYERLDYHEYEPEWRDNFKAKGKYIGVELECVASSGSYETLLELMPKFAFGRGPIVEEDGSLPYESGVELIFPPVSYKQLKNSKSAFAQTLKALEGHTVTTSRTSIGMHLNVNTEGWSTKKKALFVATVHNLKKEALEKIGGRKLTSYCYQVDDLGTLEEFEELEDHCTAAEWLPNRVELRFPGTTTDHNRVKELVAFIEVLELFCEAEERYVEATYKYYTDKLERMFVDFCKKSKKGREVLTYLYEKEPSTNSNSTAQPAQSVSPRSAQRSFRFG